MQVRYLASRHRHLEVLSIPEVRVQIRNRSDRLVSALHEDCFETLRMIVICTGHGVVSAVVFNIS